MITAPGIDRSVPAEEAEIEAGRRSGLERECGSYALFLTGHAPSRYVVEKYVDFHQKFWAPEGINGFDRLLTSVSARGPLWARLVDSYASVWRRESIVRKKIVVTLALLESSPPTCEMLDRVPAGGLTGAVIRLGFGAAGYALALFTGTLIFTPVRLWMAVRER